MQKICLSLCFVTMVFWVTANGHTHTVRTGETLYSIAHDNSLPVSELIRANPELKNSSVIHIGQQIVIPTNLKKEAPRATVHVNSSLHTVITGETLYSLSKKYNVSINDLKDWNRLDNLNVQIGQQLIVANPNEGTSGVKSVSTTPKVIAEKQQAAVEQHPVIEKPKEMPMTGSLNPRVISSNATNPEEYNNLFNSYPAKGFKVKKSRGAAVYLSDKTNGNQFLALYDHQAETGSIIRVTNLMNHQTIFVKVMGKLPATDSQQGVILKLSNSAAQQLHVLDDKFLVEVAGYTND